MFAFNVTANFSNESSSLQNIACDEDFFHYCAVKIVKILVYSIILFLSLVGNALIITIVRRRPELRNTINYFIVNMAVSDFVYPLTAIPEQLTQIATGSHQWSVGGTTGLILCKLKWFLQVTSSAVSIQSLVWIALDRFVAVVLPMRVHLISSRFRVCAIASTWVVATSTNSIFLQASQLVGKNDESFCAPMYNMPFSYMIYLRVFTALFQILPLVAMTTLYCVIAVTLRRQDKVLQCRAVHQKDQRKQRAIKMSFCIMVSFYICYIPMLIALPLLLHKTIVPCLVFEVLWFLGHAGLYLSSAVNPIICIVFVQSYRNGLKEIVNWCWRKRLSTHEMATAEQEEIRLEEIRVIKIEVNPTQS